MKISAKDSGFSVRLRSARRANNVSQEDLAGKLGISKGAVGNWESGVNFPSDPNLRKIAEILKISVTYLLTGEPPDEPPIDAEVVPDAPAGREQRISESADTKSTQPAPPSPRVSLFLSASTLDQALLDLTVRLLKCSKQDRKHIIGNIIEVVGEIEQRELLGTRSSADRDADDAALEMVRKMDDGYDRKH